jgi:serine/threonine protein kinase
MMSIWLWILLQVAILSRVRHPHLVTLLGACSESSTLVYEFLPNGSLEEFLVCAVKRGTLLWQIRIRIIAEICSALIFLHKNKPHPVVHGDLKPANILLDVNLVSKLSDFGISRLLIQSSTNNTNLYCTMHPLGTPTYMDPEFLATGELTPHSDVYSLGIVVLRLLTGRPPVGIKKIVVDALDKGDLNSIVDASAGEWPDVYAQQLAHLALSCTEMSRRCRPDLSDEVWRVVEVMRDAATATLSSASSSRSVSREICTPSYFICPISQVSIKQNLLHVVSNFPSF